jgi:ubiquinone/menaquinone biosynthesis C-methylase UbiE
MDKSSLKDVYLKRKSYQSLEVDDTDIQLKFMLEYIPEDLHAPILDAGCGNGKRALKLSKSGYTNLTGVDLFDSIPVQEIKYIKADIEDLPFRDSSFRFIYAMSVIYYPTDPEAAIREFSRVIEKSGILLLTAHTKYSLFTLRRIIMRLLKRKVVRHLQDVKFKSAGTYIKLLKKHHFEIIRVDGFYLSYIFVPLYRFICSVLFRLFKFRLPEIQSSVSRSKIIGKIKSIFGYHMVIIARKKDIMNN